LGLSIVAALVKAHGGVVDAANGTHLRGGAVTVVLPKTYSRTSASGGHLRVRG